MSNVTARSPEELYKAKKIRFAVQGLWIALLSGTMYGFEGNVMTIINSHPGVAVGSTVVIAVVMSTVVCGMQDISKAIWMVVVNLVTGRTLKEYIRALKCKKISMFLIIASLLGGPLATVAYLIGLNLCGVTYALVISSLSPIISAIVGRILYKEKISIRAGIGIAIAITGIIIIGYTPPEAGDYPYFFLGLMISFIAAIGWGLEGAFATYAADMTDPYIIVGFFRTLISGAFSIIILVPVIGMATSTGTLGFEIIGNVLSTPILLGLFIFVGLSGCLVNLTTYIGFSRVGAARGLVLVNSYAIWSIVFGLIFAALGFTAYSISTMVIVGAVIEFVGIVLVAGNPKEMVKLRDV